MQRKVFLYFLIFGGLLILLIFTLSYMLSRDFKKSKLAGVNKVTYPLSSRGIVQPMWENFPNSISFIGTDDGSRYFLYSLNLVNGENEKTISNYTVTRYIWNKNQSEVAFWGRNITTGTEGTFIFNLAKKNLRQIDQISGFPDAWSPDSNHLVINGECDAPSRHACSFIFDIELSKKEILNFNGETKPFIDLSWSPDGKRMAFIYGDPFLDKATYGLYIMDLQDHRTRMLVSGKEEGIRLSQPKWIRDGEWLVYLREGSLSESELYFVNVENANCQTNPLTKVNIISSYDVFENDDNLFFILIDKRQNILTINFKEALNPISIEKVFACSKK